MDRDSMGPSPNPLLPVSSGKLKPLARSKNDDPTFSKPDAYALVGRLAAQWRYLGEPGREDTLAQEYLAQFDGYDPMMVQDAVTRAIGKCGENHPTVGQIKDELKAILNLAKPAPKEATDYRYKPQYDYSELPREILNAPMSALGCASNLMRQGCHPDYIRFRERERALMRETKARIASMPVERFAELQGGFAPRLNEERKAA